MLRAFLLLAVACLLAGVPCRLEASDARFDRVVVAPARTSIYVGSVTLTMPAFVRTSDGYESAYHAKVFPYFFSNEDGRLRIEITDAMLAQLARGERIDFKGQGARSDGAERRLEGSAVPADAWSGALTVRVFVSPRIQLIFHTTYRFEPGGRG